MYSQSFNLNTILLAEEFVFFLKYDVKNLKHNYVMIRTQEGKCQEGRKGTRNPREAFQKYPNGGYGTSPSEFSFLFLLVAIFTHILIDFDLGYGLYVMDQMNQM